MSYLFARCFHYILFALSLASFCVTMSVTCYPLALKLFQFSTRCLAPAEWVGHGIIDEHAWKINE